MISHQQAGTCCAQSGYQIWSLSLHPLRTYESVLFFRRHWSEGWPHHGRTIPIHLCPLSFYEWQRKMQKIGRFGLLRGHSRSLFNGTCTTSYSTLIDTPQFCTVHQNSFYNLVLSDPRGATLDRGRSLLLPGAQWLVVVDGHREYRAHRSSRGVKRSLVGRRAFVRVKHDKVWSHKHHAFNLLQALTHWQ